MNKGLKFGLYVIVTIGIAAALLFAATHVQTSPSATPTATTANLPPPNTAPSSTEIIITDTGSGSSGIPTATPTTITEVNPDAPSTTQKLALPYNSVKDGVGNWLTGWGTLSKGTETLAFGASSSTNGGTIFLIGSTAWTNYDAEANVSWISGESFGILARMPDTTDFVYCDYGDHYVSVLYRANGVDYTVASGNAPNLAAGSKQELGIRVYNSKVACDVGDKDIVALDLGTNIHVAGGIGFLSWDPVKGASKIVINSYQVTPLDTDDITLIAPQNTPVATGPIQVTPTPTPPPPPAPTTTTPAAPPPPAIVVTPPPQLPYSESTFTGDTNWTAVWGSMAIDSTGAMDIDATSTSSGASVLLENTSGWDDYTFNATIDWLKGETFGLIARYGDANDYTLCQYQEPFPGTVNVYLEQYVNGNEYTLQSGQILNYNQFGGAGLSVGIEVKGTDGYCFWKGAQVVSSLGTTYDLNPPYSGAIGFTEWDPTLGTTQLVVHSVSVTKLN